MMNIPSALTDWRRDNPVRVAVLGLGFGAHTLLPALSALPGCEIVAVCASRQTRAEAIAREFGVPHATSDYREAIELDDVDLVCVCTPPPLHAAMIHAALDANRHVFSTKPLTSRLSDAIAVRDRARGLGVVTAMEFCFRYLPIRRYVRALVADGFLGELRFVSATVFGDFATRRDHELYHWKWVSSREGGGGILGASLALHHLDLLRFTFGEPHEPWGVAGTLLREKPLLEPEAGSGVGPTGTATSPEMKLVDSEDAVVLQGLLDSGAPFSLSVTWSVHHPSGERLEIYGSEGTLVVEPSGRLLGARRGEAALRELPVPAAFDLPEVASLRPDASAVVPSSALYVALAQDLLDTIRGGQSERLFATFDDGVRLLELVEPVLDRFDTRSR